MKKTIAILFLFVFTCGIAGEWCTAFQPDRNHDIELCDLKEDGSSKELEKEDTPVKDKMTSLGGICALVCFKIIKPQCTQDFSLPKPLNLQEIIPPETI